MAKLRYEGGTPTLVVGEGKNAKTYEWGREYDLTTNQAEELLTNPRVSGFVVLDGPKSLTGDGGEETQAMKPVGQEG